MFNVELILQQSIVQISEWLVLLGPIRTSPETPRTSRQYCTEGFGGCPRLPSFINNRELIKMFCLFKEGSRLIKIVDFQQSKNIFVIFLSLMVCSLRTDS